MALPRKSPFADTLQRHSAGRFGMLLFLISLGILFAATVVGFIVVRVQLSQRALWPDELPPLPWGLWVATGVILLSSVTMQRALVLGRDERAANVHAVRRALGWTLGLGVAFVAIQAWCWFEWFGVVRDNWERSEQWRFALTGFFLLSGLHAAHVCGGLIGLVTATAPANVSDAARRRRRLESCAMYWHFLAVVWLVLFALLLVGT
ncbi:MAG: heme-copper oxidase subunit III [Planctomycetes bacterium]|nr:heme-copper oxidase subunit III [Planctomycetota bacterium]